MQFMHFFNYFPVNLYVSMYILLYSLNSTNTLYNQFKCIIFSVKLYVACIFYDIL